MNNPQRNNKHSALPIEEHFRPHLALLVDAVGDAGKVGGQYAAPFQPVGHRHRGRLDGALELHVRPEWGAQKLARRTYRGRNWKRENLLDLLFCCTKSEKKKHYQKSMLKSATLPIL